VKDDIAHRNKGKQGQNSPPKTLQSNTEQHNNKAPGLTNVKIKNGQDFQDVLYPTWPIHIDAGKNGQNLKIIKPNRHDGNVDFFLLQPPGRDGAHDDDDENPNQNQFRVVRTLLALVVQSKVPLHVRPVVGVRDPLRAQPTPWGPPDTFARATADVGGGVKHGVV
jgi:acetamidase/formamidase